MLDEDHAPTTGDHQELVKLRFPLDESDVSMGVEAENLWAKPLKEGAFEIDNIPFYVYGISNNDIVSAEMKGPTLQFKDVVRRGGHSTYRVLLSDPAGSEGQYWKEKWPYLAVLGCTCEVAKSRWIAIDVPPFANADDAYAVLEKGQEECAWSIDEGHCGHPL